MWPEKSARGAARAENSPRPWRIRPRRDGARASKTECLKGGAAKRQLQKPSARKRVGQPGGKGTPARLAPVMPGDHDGHGGGAGPAPPGLRGKNGSHSKIGAVRQALAQKRQAKKTEISLGASGQRVASANYRAENQQKYACKGGERQQSGKGEAQRDAWGVCRYKITGRRNADPRENAPPASARPSWKIRPCLDANVPQAIASKPAPRANTPVEKHRFLGLRRRH